LFYQSSDDYKQIPFPEKALHYLVKLKNGKTRREECRWGDAFYSQSARMVQANEQILSIEFYDANGKQISRINP
jgi:hypothetical protein